MIRSVQLLIGARFENKSLTKKFTQFYWASHRIKSNRNNETFSHHQRINSNENIKNHRKSSLSSNCISILCYNGSLNWLKCIFFFSFCTSRLTLIRCHRNNYLKNFVVFLSQHTQLHFKCFLVSVNV